MNTWNLQLIIRNKTKNVGFILSDYEQVTKMATLNFFLFPYCKRVERQWKRRAQRQTTTKQRNRVLGKFIKRYNLASKFKSFIALLENSMLTEVGFRNSWVLSGRLTAWRGPEWSVCSSSSNFCLGYSRKLDSIESPQQVRWKVPSMVGICFYLTCINVHYSHFVSM